MPGAALSRSVASITSNGEIPSLPPLKPDGVMAR
jgi:hypothetical protein